MPRSPSSTQAAFSAALISLAGTPFTASTRPRIIGTRSTLAPGASLARNASKRSASVLGTSRKKKLGAFCGMERLSWERIVLSMTASVTSSVTPSPSDSTSDGVSAPGRWMFATAIRNSVRRGRGRRAAMPVMANATSRSSTNAPAVPTTAATAMRRSKESRMALPASAITASATIAM